MSALHAQISDEQRIADSVIGWWDVQKPPVPKPKTFNGQVFSIKQQQYLNTVTEWMKQSYIPVGGLGTYRYHFSADTNGYSPHAWGIDFRAWNVGFEKEWLDAKGHFKPIDEEYRRFDVAFNAIPASYPMYYLNGPGRFYFVWPVDGYGHSNESENQKKQWDPRIDPNAYPFVTRTNELETVYLTPDNKLPFIPVTVEEYLRQSLNALDREAAIRKDKINYQWSSGSEGDQRSRREGYAYVDDEINKNRQLIQSLLIKHKDILGQPAVIRYLQPTVRDFDGTMDPFEISKFEKERKEYYPVYKIAPEVLEKCKADQPQWMAISIPFAAKGDGVKEYELFAQVSQHFNFAYAYNYFFNPAANNGRPYQPSSPDKLKARLDAYRKHSYRNTPVNAKVNAPGVYFQDDFSGNAIGAKPAGWFFRTYGDGSVVSTVPGIPGNWCKLGRANPVTFTSVKKPLPENFTLEYDVATDVFDGMNGGRIVLYLSTYPALANGSEGTADKGHQITIEITAGNRKDFTTNNYRGLTHVTVYSKPELNEQNYAGGMFGDYETREFNSVDRLVHVKLVVNNGNMSISLNNKQVLNSAGFKLTYGKPCVACSLFPGTRFNFITWDNMTNDAEHVGAFLGNVKITAN